MITKLDAYDSEIVPGAIRIAISGTNDPDIVDIMSELHASNGKIYIDGQYYQYLDYSFHKSSTHQYMELKVEKVL